MAKIPGHTSEAEKWQFCGTSWVKLSFATVKVKFALLSFACISLHQPPCISRLIELVQNVTWYPSL